MKKIYLTLLALLAFAGAKAQVTETDWQSMSDVVALKSSEFIYGSGEVQIPICIKAHEDFQGATFYIQLPEDVTFKSLDPVVEARRASFSATGYMHTYEPQTDGTYKVLSTVAANTSTGSKGYYSKGSADDDYLFSYITVDISKLDPGEYPIKIVNETLFGMFNEEGEPSLQLLDQDITSKLVITNEIVLDENDDVFPLNYGSTYSDKTVKVKRTIKPNVWNTICLPFDISNEQCKAVFGNGVEIAAFDDYDAEYDEEDNVTSVNVKFNDVTEISANTPYIIKSENTISEFTLEHINLIPEEELIVEKGTGKGKNYHAYAQFIGTYVANTLLDDEDYLFISSNKFYYSNGNNKLKGFRAWFWFDDVLTDKAGGAGTKFFFTINDEPTAINGISSVEKMAEGVYTVSGQKVNESSLEILPKGVYIVNGKKVFKK